MKIRYSDSSQTGKFKGNKQTSKILLLFPGRKLSISINCNFSTGKASLADAAARCTEYFHV